MKHCFTLVVSISLLFFSTVNSSAQSSLTGSAIVTADMDLFLDVSSPLTSTYNANISHLLFRGADDIEWLSWNLTNNYVTFTEDYINGNWVIELRLDAPDVMGWTVADWNVFFLDMKSHYQRLYLDAINLSHP